MINEIREGLLNFDQIKGLRKALWLFLLIGITLIFFESNTQYFATSNLQARADLLVTLSNVQSDDEGQLKIGNLHKDLIKDTEIILSYTNNPSSYIFDRLLRFFQGAYLAIPLFYFIFKLLILAFKHLEKETHHLAVLAGSMAVSATAWFATILGSISVIWNSSDSLFVSWLLFPFVSFLTFLPFALWLAILRIVMPNKKQKTAAVATNVQVGTKE